MTVVAAVCQLDLGMLHVMLLLQACILYLQSYLKECKTLPPDYLSTLSFFFPVFPAYDAAVALSCLEFFLEWRYFPDFKLWTPLVLLGRSAARATAALPGNQRFFPRGSEDKPLYG